MINRLCQRLKPYDLYKSEVLTILNVGPVDLGTLDCVIEECDQRFSAEQQEEILDVVRDVLGGGEEKEENDIVVNGEDGEGEKAA